MTTAAENPHGEGFLAKAWDWIKKEFGFAETEAGKLSKDIAVFGDKVANELKNGNLVHLLEGGINIIATGINPALGALVSGFELQLPKIVDRVTGVATDINAETTRTPLEQSDDLAKYLSGLKGLSGTAFANTVAGLNAIAQEYATMNTGTIVAKPVELIASAHIIHSVSE